MPRPTLKLPKTSATGDTVENSRPRARKPVRGGAQTAKRSSTARAESKPAAPEGPKGPERRTASVPRLRSDATATPQRQAQQTDGGAAGKGRAGATQPARRGLPAADGPAAPGAAQHRVEDRPRKSFQERFDASQAATGKPGKPGKSGKPGKAAKKAYPPRGVARSSGARAFRPAPQRVDSGPELTPAETHNAAPPTRTPPSAAANPPAQAEESSGTPRGLAKESPRLSKLVSQLAQCSRREADEWIENGWVSVDGVVTNRLGARVSPKARIVIKEAASAQASESVSIVFNKPRDLPGPAAEQGREGIAALIRGDNHWAEDNSSFSFQPTHLRGLAQAARLEADEGGMLAFTQEGSVARRLTGGASRLEKEYHVRVAGELTADGLSLLRHGLSLDEVKLPPAQVSWLSEQQMRIVLLDSRKGQIRRMCEQVGLLVTEIKRVRIGSVSLGKLPPGQWRYLRDDERF